MKILVVVPTLNEAESVERAIASASQGADEIIVVDADSRDDTRVRATAAGARVIESEAGRARQLQAGVQAAAGDVVLFLHADTTLPQGWADAVRNALAEPEVVGGAFRFAFDRSSPALGFVAFGARLRVALFEFPYGDQALFVRRKLLEEIGGVPQVPMMEDLDLVRAMKQRGKLRCLPLEIQTSARRYLARGPLRTMLRNWVAGAGWLLGVERARIARWYPS